MINKIKNVLQNMEGLFGWKIVEIQKEAQELFFIKNQLDMNRSKEVQVFDVTVYVAFTIDGEGYLGQSTTEIAPTMSKADMSQILADVKKGASFVKNKAYKLTQPSLETPVTITNTFSEAPLSSWMPKLAKAIYKNDVYKAGNINSTEIFLNRTTRRIMTSEGIDVVFEGYDALVEVIGDWNGGKEAVELCLLTTFGDYDPDGLSEKVAELMNQCEERAHASEMPALKDVDVILSGESVKDFLEYFVTKSSARMKYEGTSKFEIGQDLQGDQVLGDHLTVTLLPDLKGSSQSMPFDRDGKLLKPVELIKDGRLQTLVGNCQYASYLGIEPTGQLNNRQFDLGCTSVKEMRSGPHIELKSFSSFQMNFLTGDFGGEIRLASHFNGSKVQSVSGGAISANIQDVMANMTFSSESVQYDNYIGPKHILFRGLAIAGNEK